MGYVNHDLGKRWPTELKKFGAGIYRWSTKLPPAVPPPHEIRV